MTGEQNYLNFLKHILENGEEKTDRTGTGTISTFSYETRFDMSEGLHLLTTKRVPFKLIVSELLWFIKGDTNIRYLLQNSNHIWDEWAFKKWVESDEYEGPDMTDFGRRCLVDEEFNELYQAELQVFCERIVNDENFANKYGDLGNVYGKQWRRWVTSTGDTIDQLKWLVNEIKTNPDSRRLILNAWNPEDVQPGRAALPPCHVMLQCYVNNGKLSGKLTQRSADAFLGSAFNIPSYEVLLYLLARECGLEVGEFVYSVGDAHIYSNHLEQVKEQLSREIRDVPQLVIHSDKSMFDLEVADFEVVGYNPHASIKAPVAV